MGWLVTHRTLFGCRARGRGEDGFTLVEMLVVITILSLIALLVEPRLMNYLSESKVKAARIQIVGLSSALDLFYIDNGRYPTSTEGLAALAQRPSSAADWNGPYINTAAVPNDPWGHPYAYRTPAKHSPYEIVSQGPSGQSDGTGSGAEIKGAGQ